MIFSILMMLLVLFSVACVLFFIFYLLLPSLNAQKVNTSNPLFSEQEFHVFQQADAVSPSKRAVILCSHDHKTGADGESFRGFHDCAFYASQFETLGECKYGCIGLGSCARACPRNAITVSKGLAVVNVFCDGCGLCLPKCPRKLIRLVDRSYGQQVSCQAYTLFNGSYEDKCEQFNSGVDLSPSRILKPRSYAFWVFLHSIFHRA